MLNLYFFLSYSAEIRKLPVPDLLHPPRCAAARNTTCATLSDAFSSICCVYPLPRDPSCRGRYCRFAYSLTVLHFRKVVICQKIGSDRNGHPVIYQRGYISAYYQPKNDDSRGKSTIVIVKWVIDGVVTHIIVTMCDHLLGKDYGE